MPPRKLALVAQGRKNLPISGMRMPPIPGNIVQAILLKECWEGVA